jgi:hypothetical protein
MYITEDTDLTLNSVEINHSQGYGASIATNECGYKVSHANVTFTGNGGGNVYYGANTMKPNCNNDDPLVMDNFQ